MSNVNTVILVDQDGNQFRASLDQANALRTLSNANKGGFAQVVGYRPSTGYTVKPVVDYNVMTRFSYMNLLNRKQDALDAITWATVRDDAMASPKIAEMAKVKGEEAVRAIFNERKAKELASISDTKLGNRDDSHRQAHDRCYGRICEGVRVHYATETIGGEKHPILDESGLPTADSIMLSALILNKTVRESGERKAVNSGVPVLLSNIIAKHLNQRSVGFKALSLKPGNFEMIKVGGNALMEADTKRLGDILI